MSNEELTLKNYAHIGDAIWEVFVRTYVIYKTSNSKLLHKMTTDRVNATFQKNILELITPKLNEEELELARRGRNLPLPVGRRSIQADYRQATAFEVLIGFWHINNENRLNEIYELIKSTDFFN